MTIERSPQFQQLQMFATPAEISGWRSHDYPGRMLGEVPTIMRGGDEDDAAGSRTPHGAASAYESVSADEYLDHLTDHVNSRGGISKPVVLTRDRNRNQSLLDGHHRAVVALETNRLLPVLHVSSQQGRWITDKHDREMYSKHGEA